MEKIITEYKIQNQKVYAIFEPNEILARENCKTAEIDIWSESRLNLLKKVRTKRGARRQTIISLIRYNFLPRIKIIWDSEPP